MTPKDYKKALDETVVGQEEAKRVLATAAYLHDIRHNYGYEKGRVEPSVPTPITLLVGPSGSGKTHMSKQVAKIVDAPLIYINTSDLSLGAGWAGDSLMDKLEAAQKGLSHDEFARAIIFLDEFDKIVGGNRICSKGNDWGKEVQRSMLSILDGSELVRGKELLTQTWIMAGSFATVNERNEHLKDKGPLGFVNSSLEPASPYPKNHAALEKLGFIPELSGRISQIAELKPLQEHDLMNIIKYAPDSLYSRYLKVAQLEGVDVMLTEEEKRAIVKKAAKGTRGARGMESDIERIVLEKLYDSM